MSIAASPTGAPEPVQTTPAPHAEPTNESEPLFGDIAETTPTPIPSLAGC